MASEGSSRRATPKSDRTRESILDAARTAFARKGFSGVTIKDITDLAPVTRANFYYYFSDKTELFIELGTDTYREALLLSEYEGLTYEEIGNLTGTSLSTIRIRVFRAKKRLRKVLSPIMGKEYSARETIADKEEDIV